MTINRDQQRRYSLAGAGDSLSLHSYSHPLSAISSSPHKQWQGILLCSFASSTAPRLRFSSTAPLIRFSSAAPLEQLLLCCSSPFRCVSFGMGRKKNPMSNPSPPALPPQAPPRRLPGVVSGRTQQAGAAPLPD
ncbi:unnamed protein product [Closterium sp. NIES-64]|nr:unnamed protein product [Closterium sp. NIES-64]